MTEIPESLTAEAPTFEAQLAEKDARIAHLEGVIVSASRNARALAQTTSHFQTEKVRLEVEVRRLTPTIYTDPADAAAAPRETLFIDSADNLWQVHNGGVMPVGVDATVGFDSMVFPVQVITRPTR